MRRFVSFMLFLATSCCVWGCPQNPACTPADANRIELDYQAELAAKCLGQGADCSQKPAIDAKYHALRVGYVRCASGH